MNELKQKPTPKSNIAAQEVERLSNQFSHTEDSIKDMTLDKMNEAPKQEVEPQTKLARSEIDSMPQVYLKPDRTINVNQKFNEKFRSDYEFDKEYVQFIAENNEIKGDVIEIWTRKYGGKPAEFWKVPVNKPVFGPRYLAEQIRGCTYHKLIMDERKTTGYDEKGNQHYGVMAVETTVNRLDARPVSSRKSIFMGA